MPETLTVLEAELSDERLVVASALPLDTLLETLDEIVVDADGWSRADEQSQLVVFRSRDEPVDDIAVTGTAIELDVDGTQVLLETTELATHPLTLLGEAAADADVVSVRGGPAWTASTDQGRALAWRESQRQSVVLSGDVPLDTLLRVAHGLEVVDQATWLAAAG